MKVLILLMLSFQTFAAKKCMTNVKYLYTYDGDTIKVNIVNAPKVLGEKLLVRLLGVDTPEVRGGTAESKQLAQVAKKYLEKRIGSGKDLRLCNCVRDKYFRIDCILKNKLSDNLNQEMIKYGYGVPYSGGEKH